MKTINSFTLCPNEPKRFLFPKKREYISVNSWCLKVSGDWTDTEIVEVMSSVFHDVFCNPSYYPEGFKVCGHFSYDGIKAQTLFERICNNAEY